MSDGVPSAPDAEDDRLEPVAPARTGPRGKVIARASMIAVVSAVGVAGIVGATPESPGLGRAGLQRAGPPVSTDETIESVLQRPTWIVEEPPVGTGVPPDSTGSETSGRRPGPGERVDQDREPTLRRAIPEEVEPPDPVEVRQGPPWATSTRTTDAGYVVTDLGCAGGTSAAALDAFFAQRVGPVIGHDYQHVYPLGGDRYLWVFQDSFIDHPGVASRLDQASFAHNTALLQEGSCFSLMHRGTAQSPESFEQGTGEQRLARWFWPMGGEVSGGTLSMFWVEMYNVDVDLGPLDGLGWYPIGTYLATYDVDTLARLDFRPAPNPGVAPIYGFAVSSDDEHTYLFGNSFDQNLQRQGGYDNGPHSATSMYLARTPLGQLDAAPEYRTADGWSDDPADAQPILQRYWAENPMQPRYLGGQWVAATKADGYWGGDLVIDAARQPWGPWTTVHQTPATPRGGDPLMLTYHAHLMPWLSDGQLVVSLSQNARLMLRDAWPNPARYRLRFLAAPFVEAPPAPPTTNPPTTNPPTTNPPTTNPPTTKSPTTTTYPRPTTTTRSQQSTTTTDPSETTPSTPPTTESTPVPVGPTALDDEARRSMPHGRPVHVPVLRNDERGDAALDPLSVVLSNGDTSEDVPGGRFQVAGDGVVVFTPADGFVGRVATTYRVSDTEGRSDAARVSVEVADPPVAAADVWDDGVQGVVLRRDPLQNDARSLGTGRRLEPSSVVFPSDAQPGPVWDEGKRLVVRGEGTYTIGGDGWVTFTPDPAFSGEAAPVRYAVSDTDGVTVSSTITVTMTTDPAPVARDVRVPTGFDAGVAVDVLAADQPASAGYAVSLPGGDGTTVSVPGDGVFTVSDDQTVWFEPEFGKVGETAPVPFEITDGDGDAATAELVVIVGRPAFGERDHVPTTIGTAVTHDVLRNDRPTGGATADPTTVRFPDEGQPEGAEVAEGGGTAMTVPGVGTYAVEDDGRITFEPDLTFVGTTPAIWYRVLDTNGALGAARLTVDVQG